MSNIPYTYLIGWLKLDKWYYGVRTAKNCHPGDLWTTYFTSSKYVKEFITQYGEPDIIQIRKIFDNKEKASLWEHKVLRRINAVKDTKWLNKTDNKCIDFYNMKYNTFPGTIASANKSRGKTYEDIFNDPSKIEAKKKNASIIATKNWNDPIIRQQMSKKPKDTTNYRLRALKSWKDEKTAYKRNKHKYGPKPKILCCICCKKEMSKLGLRNHLSNSNNSPYTN